MSEANQYCKCDLKYEQLSPIDSNVLTQIKLVFIFSNSEATDIIFVTNIDNVYAFGTNFNGRLGFGNTSPVKEPTIVTELCGKSLMNIQSGRVFMVGLNELGDVYTWGYDQMGQLGNGSYTNTYLKPSKINLNNQLVNVIKCCQTRTFLLTQSDQIYWFGYRSNLGPVSSPTHIEYFREQEMTQISCGLDHTLALTVTGQVFSWGTNNNSCLGLGQNNHSSDTPKLVELNAVNLFVKQISCGNHHNLLLTSDGDIYSFGYNSSGQLGTGDNVIQNRPKLIKTSNKFCEIFAFENMSIALNNTKNILVWGLTNKGQFTSPTKIKINSLQETINYYSQFVSTYKPLSSADIFIDKPQNPVIETMAKAFNNPKNSDLKFKVLQKGTEDQFEYIYCHKWFVEENSEHFQKMFANNWSESEKNVIEIPGYSYEAYYQFIRCLYTDYIETKDIELLIEFLSITEEYLAEKMKTKCVQRIKPLVNDQNVCSIYSSSLTYRSKQLEEYCFEFMSKHIHIITQTEDFEKMDSNYAKHFLRKYSERK